LVVGEPGSGVTTFVGLLYTAVVRFGIEESDRFRFHAERESILRLESIYGALGEGRFPETELGRNEGPLAFVFGFRRRGVGPWALADGNGEAEFQTVPVQVGEMPAEEIAELGEHAPVLDDATRRLLRSPVLVPLVDAGRLPPEPGGIDGLPLARYDRQLARTMETVARFLAAERSRRARRLFPLFVLTKFDSIPDGTRKALDAPAGGTSTWTRDDRSSFGARLLARHLPETDRFLHTGPAGRVVVRPPAWFFSGLALDSQEGTEPRIRRRSRVPVGGWEPEYPYEEYRALLEELGRVSREGPRESTG
jgi:hypothetical protein